MVLDVTTLLGYANEEILRSCVILDEAACSPWLLEDRIAWIFNSLSELHTIHRCLCNVACLCMCVHVCDDQFGRCKLACINSPASIEAWLSSLGRFIPIWVTRARKNAHVPRVSSNYTYMRLWSNGLVWRQTKFLGILENFDEIHGWDEMIRKRYYRETLRQSGCR